jgi:hypothetical protein
MPQDILTLETLASGDPARNDSSTSVFMTDPVIDVKTAIQLAIPDADVTLSANEGFYWVAVSRQHHGQAYSHSVKVSLDATGHDIENARETFKIWWAETIKEQIP